MSPTKAEKKYWNRLANEVGCIVCRNEYYELNPSVSIHHIDGRTKKGCHSKILPLCYLHHQGSFGIHNTGYGKKKWERIYGTQEELKQQCDKILDDSETTAG